MINSPVFTPVDSAPLPDPPKFNILSVILTNIISRVDLETKLKNLNLNQSVEQDGIHHKLFWNSLGLKCIPAEWELAYITLVNYKSITISTAIGKMLESIFNYTVIQHLKTQGRLVSLCQHCFCSAKSVETNLIDVVTKLTDKGFLVDVNLLDFAKAFDKVCYRKLYIKLQAIGINTETIDWVTLFLSNRKRADKVLEKMGKHVSLILWK